MFAGLCRDRANPGGVVIAICFNNAICSGLYRLRLRARHIKLRIPLPITTKWSVTGNLHHLQGRALALENLHILIELGQAQFAKLLIRSEEHTSELQSLMRISYAVFCLQKKKQRTILHKT